MRRLLAQLAISLSVAWPTAVLASVDATTTTLPNGLTVIIAPVHVAPVASVGVLYKVGSRNETPWTTGVAHQVEHMMFKGTTDLLKPGDIDRRFIDNNGSTDQDQTYYYESFQKDGLESALQVEADRMERAAIDPAALASENGVVLSELEGSANDPVQLLDEQVAASAMQAHQYHWPVGGWQQVVETFATRRDMVYDFYSHHYAPQNAVLVVAGDIEPDAALALVHKYFDDVSPRPVTALEPIVEPAQHGVRRVALRGPGGTSRLEMAYHVPGAYSEDAAALAVLDAALAGGQSSRLYKAVVDEGWATDVSTTPNDAVDPYLYTIAAPLERDVSFDDARTVIERELRSLGDRPLSAAELARAKKLVVASRVYDHDGIEALAQQLATWQAWTGDWRNDARATAQIEAVTAAQVQAVARRYLTPDNLTVGTYSASGGSELKPAPHASHRFTHVAFRAELGWTPRGKLGRQFLRSGTNSEIAEAAPSIPARFVLANGLVLIVQENHANPDAVIEISTAAGSVSDPPAKAGLAALTQEMLLRGTRNRSYDRLESDIDALAITIGTAAGISSGELSAQTLADDEPKTMDLLGDVLMHPAFSADSFTDAQDQLVSERRGAQDDPAVVARDTLYKQLFSAASPWSRPSDGSVDGLRNARLADVKSFYRSRYAPNDTTIVVVGDVAAQEVRAQVERLFGGWQTHATPLPSIDSGVRALSATLTIATPLSGGTQVEVYAGAGGVPLAAPDHDAAQLMNFILGGGSFVSRLLHRVRDVDGYVYNIDSTFHETPLGAGPWTMRFGADAHNVDKALADAVNEMRALQRDGVSADDLAEYRRLAVDDVITGELNDQGVADQLLSDELFGRGLDYPRRLPQIYAAITPAMVQAAAQKYLHPDALLISTAGPRY